MTVATKASESEGRKTHTAPVVDLSNHCKNSESASATERAMKRAVDETRLQTANMKRKKSFKTFQIAYRNIVPQEMTICIGEIHIGAPKMSESIPGFGHKMRRNGR